MARRGLPGCGGRGLEADEGAGLFAPSRNPARPPREEAAPRPPHADALVDRIGPPEEAARNTKLRGLAASGWHTAAVTMRLLVESDHARCPRRDPLARAGRTS